MTETQDSNAGRPVATITARLAYPETDATIGIGQKMISTGEYRDRYDYDRHKILLNAIEAWRVNPMARRAIELTTQFVLGQGVTITVAAEEGETVSETQSFIDAWQNHRANNIPRQLTEWADELWRSGNLILLGSIDDAGMTYYRPIPAELVSKFETYANDPYRLKRITLSNLEGKQYNAYKKGTRQRSFILFFPINRPAGGIFGESDLAPVLRYISLYTDWLIDRAAINKYIKPSYIVEKSFNSSEEKKKFALETKPPIPGSTIVADVGEKWGTLQLSLDAFNAAEDGLAIKRMIAAGMGFPMHYFAEPESSTRTTAEAAGTPTFRRLQQRQLWFTNIIREVVQVTLEVRNLFANDVNPQAKIEIRAPDISERDNAQMALSANRIASALLPFFDTLGAEEIISMIYRFAGESKMPKVDPDARPLSKTKIDSDNQISPDEAEIEEVSSE